MVALRKESVDRNVIFVPVPLIQQMSLSARRAWIEIVAVRAVRYQDRVALRKESVDRNGLLLLTYHRKFGSRSPQGERG